MMRATITRYYAMLGTQGPQLWLAARNGSRDVSKRTFVTFSQTPLSRLGSVSMRQSIPKSQVQRTRTSRLRSTPRNFHNTSRLRDAKNVPREPLPKDTKAAEPQGLSARLKKLSREYGWSAVGVYLGLSVLDFPFCFLLVRIVGTEKIGQLEHFIVSNVKKAIPQSLVDRWHEYKRALKQSETETFGNDEMSEHVEMAGWGVEEAEARNKAEASLGTQLALAYAIHKSFIFVRVPLTAAVTPKVVKVLRSWGWNIGKRRPKVSKK